MEPTPEPADAVAGPRADTDVGVPPPVGSIQQIGAEPAGEPSVLDRVRSALAHTTARQVLGWVLVVGWLAWLAAVFVVQPRLVSHGFLADDLAQGRVTSYRVVTVEEDGRHGPASGPYRVNVYPAGADHSEVVDGQVIDGDGRTVTVAYWVDSPVAALRVLDPDGPSFSTAEEVVARFRDAGVPEASAGVFFRGLPANTVNNAATVLLVVTMLVVILGPRPRRGTRWFWFWLLGGPLAIAVPVFAVAELVRPRYEPEGTVHPPGVAGRWSGLTGWVVGALFSIGGGWVLSALSGVAPIWFLRG